MEQIQQQRAEKAKHLEPEEPHKIEQRVLKLEERRILSRWGQAVEGVTPTIGGLATGQGFALGVQYLNKSVGGHDLQLRSSARASIKKSQKFDLQLTKPRLLADRLELDFLAAHQNLTQIDYYGPGPDSSLDDRTSFRLEDTAFDGTAKFRPFADWLVLTGRAGLLNVNTGRGQRTGFPSAEDLFSATAVPGLADQTHFLRTGGGAMLEFRDNPAGPRSGGSYSADWMYYGDRGLGLHDFKQLNLEAQHYFPFMNKKRVVMLRGRSEMRFTEPGQVVPFYLQSVLGGPRELRGFRNYRFYGNNALVLNAEYRWEAFSGLDMALFLDAGKVTNRRADIDLSDLETAAGIGFRFNVQNATFLRLDVAFSHEATRVWFRFGSPF